MCWWWAVHNIGSQVHVRLARRRVRGIKKMGSSWNLYMTTVRQLGTNPLCFPPPLEVKERQEAPTGQRDMDLLRLASGLRSLSICCILLIQAHPIHLRNGMVRYSVAPLNAIPSFSSRMRSSVPPHLSIPSASRCAPLTSDGKSHVESQGSVPYTLSFPVSHGHNRLP